MTDASGAYSAGTYYFFYVPYKVIGGANHVLGLTVAAGGAVSIEAPDNAVLLGAPTVTGGNVDGVYLLRYDGDTSACSYRDVGLGVFPLTDRGTGWTAGMFFSFSSLPPVQRLLWARADQGSNPETIHVALSPLGGWCFDSELQELVDRLRPDMVVRPTVTMSFWFCPQDEQSTHAAGMRGIYGSSRMHLGFETVESSSLFTMTFGSASIDFNDHAAGDWYLVVASIDDAKADGWLTQLTVQRLRDGATRSATGATDPFGGFLAAATASSNVWDELAASAWGVGGAMHWGYHCAALYDRIGVWNRVLSAEEVDALYGVGLGWSPQQ